MMWMQIILVKRALLHKPLAWIVRLLLATGLLVASLVYWWVNTSVLHDLQRQAQQLTIDIVVLPHAEQSLVEECAANLRRRPDVASVTLLDSRTVWMLFQQELGVQSSGLTDVASMPNVIQVQLVGSWASAQRAKAVQNHVYAVHQGVVERVLIPRQAFQEIDAKRDNVLLARTIGTPLLLLLAFAACMLTLQPLYGLIISRDVHRVLGINARRGIATMAALATLLILVTAGLSTTAVMYAGKPLQQNIPWLIDFLTAIGV
jgi:cell division protein FtsX